MIDLTQEEAAPNVTQLVRFDGAVYAIRWIAGMLVFREIRRGG